MKTYLEIKVPINYDDPWFKELRSHFAGFPVRWQKDFYHITLVFVNDTPKAPYSGKMFQSSAAVSRNM